MSFKKSMKGSNRSTSAKVSGQEFQIEEYGSSGNSGESGMEQLGARNLSMDRILREKLSMLQ